MNVVHVGVGPISQSDVDLAQACGACIVGFNVKSPSAVAQAATRASIKVSLLPAVDVLTICARNL